MTVASNKRYDSEEMSTCSVLLMSWIMLLLDSVRRFEHI